MSKIGDIDQKLHVLSSSSMDDHLLKNHYHRRITIIWRERLFEAEPSRAISRFTRKSPNRSKLRPTLRICAPVYFVFVFQFVLAFWLIWGAKYCKWSAFLSFFTQPADIVVLNEMKVPSWYFGFLQETIRDVISIAWWLWTAESLVIISDDLDALEIWSSTSTPMRPQQRFHDHKYKITKNTQKQIHQYIWSKTHKYLIIHLYTNEATAKRIRSFYSTAVFHKLQQYA